MCCAFSHIKGIYVSTYTGSICFCSRRMPKTRCNFADRNAWFETNVKITEVSPAVNLQWKVIYGRKLTELFFYYNNFILVHLSDFFMATTIFVRCLILSYKHDECNIVEACNISRFL